MKIPGILGGLGPETTARIYLELAMKEGETYPEIIISNVSFPKQVEEDVIKGKDCSPALPFMLNSVRQLENAKADFAVLPCNTLHVLLPNLRKESSIRFVDLIEEVASAVKKNFKCVGIISTSQTRKQRLYENLLGDVKAIRTTDEEQERISEIIIRIIRKTATDDDRKFLEKIIQDMVSKGAEKVILACTDLANLVIGNPDTLDSTAILIDAIIRKMEGD
jgi:aspartate racemase